MGREELQGLARCSVGVLEYSLMFLVWCPVSSYKILGWVLRGVGMW